MAELAPMDHKDVQALQELLDQLDVGERKAMLGNQEMLAPWVTEVTLALLEELALPAPPESPVLQEILALLAGLVLLALLGRQALQVPLEILGRAV